MYVILLAKVGAILKNPGLCSKVSCKEMTAASIIRLLVMLSSLIMVELFSMSIE